MTTFRDFTDDMTAAELRCLLELIRAAWIFDVKAIAT